MNPQVNKRLTSLHSIISDDEWNSIFGEVISDRDIVEACIAFKNHKNPEVRQLAADILSIMHPQGIFDKLMKWFLGEENTRARVSVLGAMWSVDRKKTRKYIKKNVDTEGNPVVRKVMNQLLDNPSRLGIWDV